ncbi:MAG: IS200/IS605 family accessory protein TnpB-related protein [Methanosarcinales archaeon]
MYQKLYDWCVRNNIDTVVIGHSNNWKQNTGMSKRNNQNFVQIPFNKLLHKIKYKGE